MTGKAKSGVGVGLGFGLGNIIAYGWTMLTGALEWVRCKARVLRNTVSPANGGMGFPKGSACKSPLNGTFLPAVKSMPDTRLD